MKSNVKGIEALRIAVEDINRRKKDYCKKSSEFGMDTDETLNGFQVNDLAHGQLAEKMGIPKGYYDRMTKVQGLRSTNVNSWLGADPAKRYLIRTLDDRVRAFMSDSYRPIDNALILSPLMKIIESAGETEVMATCLTEKRMYVQVFFPRIRGEVNVGDVVQTGVTVSNSEVGEGKVEVWDSLFVLKCRNGNVGESIFSKIHLDRRIGDNVEDYEFYRADTIEAELTAFLKKLRDTLAHAVSQANLEDKIARIRIANGDEIKSLPKVVKQVQKRYGFTDDESQMILVNVAAGAGTKTLTRWGLVNGITALSHGSEDPDRQFEYERTGTEVLNLAPGQWESINEG